jgi:hypothetical protein
MGVRPHELVFHEQQIRSQILYVESQIFVNLGVLFELKKCIHCHMFVIYLIRFLERIEYIMCRVYRDIFKQ